MNRPLIEAKNLGKVYESDGVKTVALADASFIIEEGEFVAIMGPSGSGKSTLLHILGFLDKHSHGSYHFESKTINQHTEDELARVRNEKMGFVFQAFNLLPRATVLENVTLPLIYSNVPENEWKTRAMEAIKSVDLDHRIEHETSQLSGGEKQRVAIARALVLNPDIVFADEPTGNLDSKSGEVVMEYIEKLNDAGKTIILITHETYTSEYADRVIKLKDGKVVSDTKTRHRRRTQNEKFRK